MPDATATTTAEPRTPSRPKPAGRSGAPAWLHQVASRYALIVVWALMAFYFYVQVPDVRHPRHVLVDLRIPAGARVPGHVGARRRGRRVRPLGGVGHGPDGDHDPGPRRRARHERLAGLPRRRRRRGARRSGERLLRRRHGRLVVRGHAGHRHAGGRHRPVHLRHQHRLGQQPRAGRLRDRRTSWACRSRSTTASRWPWCWPTCSPGHRSAAAWSSSDPTGGRPTGRHRVQRIRFGAYVAGGLLAGLAGLVLVATVGGFDSASSGSTCCPPWPPSSSAPPSCSRVRSTRSGRWWRSTSSPPASSACRLSGYQGWIQNAFYGAGLVVAVTLAKVVRDRSRKG